MNRILPGTDSGSNCGSALAPLTARVSFTGRRVPGSECEGDSLPGLVIDVFGRTIVVDFYTACMRSRQISSRRCSMNILPTIRWYGAWALMRQSVSCATLPPEPHEITFHENGITFNIPLDDGQKTGYYIDQHENRRLVTRWAAGNGVGPFLLPRCLFR